MKTLIDTHLETVQYIEFRGKNILIPKTEYPIWTGGGNETLFEWVLN